MAPKSTTKAAKRIAGVRIPKGYRRAASGMARLSKNPLVREMALAGAVAAAGVLVRNKGVRAAAGKLGLGARGTATETVDLAGRIGQAITSAITSAAQRLSADHDDRDRVEPEEKPAAPIDTKDGAMPYVS
jgi:hypothetical protein